jgi:hypothetical protein
MIDPKLQATLLASHKAVLATHDAELAAWGTGAEAMLAEVFKAAADLHTLLIQQVIAEVAVGDQVKFTEHDPALTLVRKATGGLDQRAVFTTDGGEAITSEWFQGDEDGLDEAVYYERYVDGQRKAHGYVHRTARTLVQVG